MIQAVSGEKASFSWLLVAAVLGYAPIGLAGSLFGGSFAPPFRTSVLLLSAYVLLRYPPGRQMLATHLWFLAFLVLYFLRLLYDYFAGAPGDPGTALVFYGAAVMIPALALCTARPGFIDWRRTGWRLVVVGGLTCVGALAMFQLQLDEALVESGRLEAQRLNTITMGYTAVTTMLSALYLLPGSNAKQRLLLAGLGGAATQALFLSAARGPLVALVVCLVFYMVFARRFFWPLLLSAACVAVVLADPESILITRFMILWEGGAVNDLSASERLEFQGRAWEQFLGSPVLGSGFAEKVSGTYPHNIVIEAFMATGVVGVILLVFLLVRAIRCSTWMVRAGDLLPVLLLVQYAVNSQISGSLAASDALWATTAVVLAHRRISATRRPAFAMLFQGVRR